MIIIIIPILILYLKGEYPHYIQRLSSVGRGAPVRVRAGAQRGPGRVAAAAPLELLPHPRPGHHPSPGKTNNKQTKTKTDQAASPLQVDNLSYLSPQNLPFLGDSVAGELTPVRKIIYRPFSLPFRQHIRVPGKRHDYVIYGVHIMDGP